MKTDIFDKRLNNIPYSDHIYKYVVDNALVDGVVEFSLFNINVGVNNGGIIVYELRTDY